jgi:hypothetical protein
MKIETKHNIEKILKAAEVAEPPGPPASCRNCCPIRKDAPWNFVLAGKYQREIDKSVVQSYRCCGCGATYSDATESLAYKPNAVHIRKKSRRACVAGQGELKKGGHDPMFPLNHKAAMLRANVNRLIRKTWFAVWSVTDIFSNTKSGQLITHQIAGEWHHFGFFPAKRDVF